MKSTYENKWGHIRRPKKGNSARKNAKRLEAEARQKFWNSLTLQQKLLELSNRPGNCAKQIKKLIGQ